MTTSVSPTRADALALLREYTGGERLVNHGLAVEGVMRHMAQQHGEDVEKWGIIGLIHDLDWERFPDEHCHKSAQILRERDWPEEYIHAVLSHGWGLCTDVEPTTLLEQTLFAVDELTGLVTATALVRPSRSVMDMKAKSVLKKWKVKSFAAGADRDVIQKGCDLLGMERSDLITDVIAGMREVADQIGLAGS